MEELFKDPIVYYVVVLLAFVLGQATMFACEVISYWRAKIENELTNIGFNEVERPNNVHFYVTADKVGNSWQFKLWLGKPRRSRFSECWLPSNKISSLLAQTKEEFELYGLKPSNYNFTTWEHEPVEVLLNLKY